MNNKTQKLTEHCAKQSLGSGHVRFHEENQLYYYGTLSRMVFVHFLGELKTPKGHFEIKWPLERLKKNYCTLCKAVFRVRPRSFPRYTLQREFWWLGNHIISILVMWFWWRLSCNIIFFCNYWVSRHNMKCVSHFCNYWRHSMIYAVNVETHKKPQKTKTT